MILKDVIISPLQSTNFKNIFFLVAHNTKIRVHGKNNNAKISKCIGALNPEANVNSKNESIFNFGSCFPSELILLKNNYEEKNKLMEGLFY